MNLSVSVIILLFTVKSKLSSPHNRVLRGKGAMCTCSSKQEVSRGEMFSLFCVASVNPGIPDHYN